MVTLYAVGNYDRKKKTALFSWDTATERLTVSNPQLVTEGQMYLKGNIVQQGQIHIRHYNF
jgi:hypothetical protein